MTHAPLPGATVRISSSKIGAVADHHGFFHVHDVAGDSVDVDVYYVGYVRKKMRVPVAENLTIELVPTMIDAGPVVVQEQGNAAGGLPTQRVESLSEQQINEVRGQTIGAALQTLPGVTVMSSGPAVTRAVVHGMTGQRIIVSNAGVAQEGQQWASDHGTEIDPFVPVRMSVVKGPSSVLYGPNAMGGVVRIDPSPFPSIASDQAQSVSGEVTANFFSNNVQGAAGANVQVVRLQELPVAIRLYGGGRKASDARTPDYWLDNTAYDQWTIGTNTEFKFSDGNDAALFIVNASLFDADLGVFKGAHLGNAADMRRAIERGRPSADGDFSYTIDRPRQEVQHIMVTAGTDVPLTNTSMLKVQYGFQQNDRSEFDAHNTNAMNLLLATHSLDAQIEHSIAPDWHGHAGINAVRQVNDRTGSSYIVPDYVSKGIGAFAFESVAFDELMLSAGARYDMRWLTSWLRFRNDTSTTEQEKVFGSFSGSVGATYEFSRAFSTSLNISTAWRPPQVNELYSNDVHHGVAQYEIGDSTLLPERTVGLDVALSLLNSPPSTLHSPLSIQIGGYVNLFSDYIAAIPDPDNPTVTIRGSFPTYRYQQFDAVVWGIDLSAGVDITEEFSAYAKGSLVRGTDIEADQPLFLMPSDRLRIGAHLHAHDVLGLHHVFADLSVMGVRTQDRYLEGMDYAPPPPGYVVTDLMVGIEIEFFGTASNVSMSVLNLFDVAYRDYLSRYRYFADDPGRDFVVRFTVPFGRE